MLCSQLLLTKVTVVAVQDKGMTRVMAGVGVTPSATDSATAMLSSRRPSSMRSSPTKELKSSSKTHYPPRGIQESDNDRRKRGRGKSDLGVRPQTKRCRSFVTVTRGKN